MERLRDQHERVWENGQRGRFKLSISFPFRTCSRRNLFRKISIRKSTHVCCFFDISVPESFLNLASRFSSCCGTFTKNGRLLSLLRPVPPFFRGTVGGRLLRGDGGADVALVFVVVLQGIETFVHNATPEKPRDAEKRLWTRQTQKTSFQDKRRLQVRSSAATGRSGPEERRRCAPQWWGGSTASPHAAAALGANAPQPQRPSTWSVLLVVTHTQKTWS